MKWKRIDRSIARKMLETIIDNLNDEKVLIEYCDALEKRYRKPQSTITNYIFYGDLTVNEILDKLEKDTVTYL